MPVVTNPAAAYLASRFESPGRTTMRSSLAIVAGTLGYAVKCLSMIRVAARALRGICKACVHVSYEGEALSGGR